MFKKEINLSKVKIYYALIFILILLTIGTFLFSYTENWSYIDSFYFSTSTLTTVGYGDLVPLHDTSKIITSVYALLGVGTFLFCLSVIAEYYFYKRFTTVNKKIEKIKEKK